MLGELILLVWWNQIKSGILNAINICALCAHSQDELLNERIIQSNQWIKKERDL